MPPKLSGIIAPNRAVTRPLVAVRATLPARDTASDGGTEEDAAESGSVDISHHGCRASVEDVGAEPGA